LSDLQRMFDSGFRPTRGHDDKEALRALNETVVDLLDVCFFNLRACRAGSMEEASEKFKYTSGSCESKDRGSDGRHYNKFILIAGERFRFNDRENPFTAAYRVFDGPSWDDSREGIRANCATFAELIMLSEARADSCRGMPEVAEAAAAAAAAVHMK
jgi:hypothetical protein